MYNSYSDSESSKPIGIINDITKTVPKDGPCINPAVLLHSGQTLPYGYDYYQVLGYHANDATGSGTTISGQIGLNKHTIPYGTGMGSYSSDQTTYYGDRAYYYDAADQCYYYHSDSYYIQNSRTEQSTARQSDNNRNGGSTKGPRISSHPTTSKGRGPKKGPLPSSKVLG